MTNDSCDAGPPGRAVFVCGTVVGACLGFAIGHVFVWTRWRPETRHEYAGSTGKPEFWSHAAPGRRTPEGRLENFGEVPTGEDAPSSFLATVPHRFDGPPPIDLTAPRSPVRVATDTSSTILEPDSLPHASHAAPIDEQTRYREQVTRSIIAQEMPQATAQEREVWFDVLRGLEASDVKGILRMRKNLRGEGDDVLAAPSYELEPFHSPGLEFQTEPRVAGNAWHESLQALRRVRDIRLHNLCNAATIGFPRFEPVTCDVTHQETGAGVRLVRVEHDVTAGEFVETGRPLDVAVEGCGFLQVRWKDRLRLTRCGRLKMDDERHLILATTAEPWKLDPPVSVPEEIVSLTIHQDGRITGGKFDTDSQTDLGSIPLMTTFDTSALHYVGEGLFETTSASGPARPLKDGGTLRQYGVERLSPATIRDEFHALQREQALIERLGHAAAN